MLVGLLALAVSAGAASLTAPRSPPKACGDGGPMIAMYAHSGFGPVAPKGLLIAIWSDGRIAKAKDFGDPQKGHIEGHLDAREINDVHAELERQGVLRWKQPLVAADVASLHTRACVGETRVSFWHTGMNMVRGPAPRLYAYLSKLTVPNSAPTDEFRLENAFTWMGWFKEPTLAPCKDEGPMVGVMLNPGRIIVAVWSDGRIVRARDGLDPENGQIEGRVSSAKVAEIEAAIEKSGAAQWEQGPPVFDAGGLRITRCSDVERRTIEFLDENSGAGAANQLAQCLLSVEVPDAKPTNRLRLSNIKTWIPWFRIGRTRF